MSSIKKMSRREFIKTATVAGAGVAAVNLFAFPTGSAHAAPIPEKWDKEADVVIVGAGGAGLVAAIEAMENGASVLLLEKTGVAGGTTTLSGAVIQAANTKYQKEFAKVTDDTTDKHLQYWLLAGENQLDPDLVKLMADNGPTNIDWLVNHGVNYVNVYGVDPISYIDPKLMVPRIHVPGGAGTTAAAGTGKFHVQALNDYATKKGAQFLFKTPVTALVRDPQKGVLGVVAKTADGKDLNVKANKAVILATSSFDQNKDMAKAFSPQQYWALTNGVVLSSPAATGDGIKMGMEIGADLAGMGGTIGVPSTGIGTASVPGIWVNKYGQRFINEASHYAYAMRAIFDQELHEAWAIFDANGKKLGGKALGGLLGSFSDDLKKEIDAGTVKTGATVPELAKAMGVNADQLQLTIDKWNKDMAAGKDTLFGKEVSLKALDTGPYFATKISEVNLGSIGGLKINPKAQVIDVHGAVIPRLYAGGMVAGGFIGPYYPGSGTAINATVTFGRIAGKNATAESPWSSGT